MTGEFRENAGDLVSEAAGTWWSQKERSVLGGDHWVGSQSV